MSRDIVAAGNTEMKDQFTAYRNKGITKMQYLTHYEEMETFQKMRKQRKREHVDTWNKETKPWRKLQREKQKQKYSNLLSVA